MPISWEVISAVGSLLSSVAVIAAVIIAVRQVRVGAEQVEHLRRATQLEGTMKIFAMMNSEEQQTARRFVSNELADRLNDPQFRFEATSIRMSPSLEKHPELQVLRLMEMIGVYVKHGLVDDAIIFDYWIPAVHGMWELLDSAGIIAMHREALGDEMWENFEDLYHRSQRFDQARMKQTGASMRPLTGRYTRMAGASAATAQRNEVVADARES